LCIFLLIFSYIASSIGRYLLVKLKQLCADDSFSCSVMEFVF
jgi:hypothetical protein